MEWWENEYPVTERLTKVTDYDRGMYDGYQAGKIVGAGKTVAYGGLIYGGYKAGKWAYNKIKDKKKDDKEKAANESWYNDPGAQQIMEAYFSEFPDADIY